MTTDVRCAVTIAGSDSGGGAGIQADLKVFQAHRVYGASVVTAVTAQNSAEVRATQSVDVDVVVEQIAAVAADLPISAVKTGMLVNAEIVAAVAAAIEHRALPNLVVDPVFVATSGARLLDDAGIAALAELLLPHARCVTPNAAEAAILVGESVESVEEMGRAARRLCAMGADSAVVTGGHSIQGGELVDVLCDGTDVYELRVEPCATGGAHGTGCAFSAALVAGLALRMGVHEAVRSAQDYVGRALAARFRGAAGERLLRHDVEVDMVPDDER